jgi:hypothetical protein
MILAGLALFGFVIFWVGVASNYQKHNQREPQGSERAHNSQSNSDYTAPSKPGIHIECEPNCSAQESKDHANEGPIARFIRKAIDDPLTAFTGILALTTLFLAGYTAIVARATKAAADHIPRVERAYIFADVFFNQRGLGVTVHLSNLGKTPAEISKIAFELCEKIPASPNYSGEIYVGIRLRAGIENVPTELNEGLSKFKGKPTVIYGRVYYRDIFGDNHSSGFIFRISNDEYGTTNIASVNDAPSIYTEWN